MDSTEKNFKNVFSQNSLLLGLGSLLEDRKSTLKPSLTAKALKRILDKSLPTRLLFKRQWGLLASVGDFHSNRFSQSEELSLPWVSRCAGKEYVSPPVTQPITVWFCWLVLIITQALSGIVLLMLTKTMPRKYEELNTKEHESAQFLALASFS